MRRILAEFLYQTKKKKKSKINKLIKKAAISFNGEHKFSQFGLNPSHLMSFNLGFYVNQVTSVMIEN